MRIVCNFVHQTFGVTSIIQPHLKQGQLMRNPSNAECFLYQRISVVRCTYRELASLPQSSLYVSKVESSFTLDEEVVTSSQVIEEAKSLGPSIRGESPYLFDCDCEEERI